MKSLELINKRLNEVNKRLDERQEYMKVSSNGISPYIVSLVDEKERLEEAKKDLEILKIIKEHLFFTQTGDNKKQLYIATDITNYLSKKDKELFKKIKKWSDENDR